MRHQQRYRRPVADIAMWPDFVAASAPMRHLLPGVVRLGKQRVFRHSLLNLPLKGSMKLWSVGLPGREKSDTTPY
jgi:hypothetical protein